MALSDSIFNHNIHHRQLMLSEYQMADVSDEVIKRHHIATHPVQPKKPPPTKHK